MSEIPTIEPAEFIAGDTVKWTKSLSDYPADAFALNYRLVPLSGGAPISIAATADGTDYTITISAATSAGYSAGTYRWYAYATDLGTGLERYSIDHGELDILPDPTSSTVADLRSHARKVLDAIEAVLEGTATSDQQKITIDGDTLEKKPITELLQLRSVYAAEVRREEAAEAIRKGLGTGNRILTRFC